MNHESHSPTEALSPASGLFELQVYRRRQRLQPIDLHLDSNEAPPPDPEWLRTRLAEMPLDWNRYPDASELEAELAERHGVRPEQVLVTSGADEALDRFCRTSLVPGREFILPIPTFEMLDRYAVMAGAELKTPRWFEGDFPLDAVLEQIGPKTAAIAVVSPNNPTGAVACAEDLQALSKAARQAWLMVDLAYTEFADDDLTQVALALPNAIVFRTFSKAQGLAGLRVGYALGPASWIEWMRTVGSPFSVSAPSLALARSSLSADAPSQEAYLQRARQERERLYAELIRLGVQAWPSQANFVLARFEDPAWVQDALAGFGIAVRRFPHRSELQGCLRIGCPGTEAAFGRLLQALELVLAPEAVIVPDTVLSGWPTQRITRVSLRDWHQTDAPDLDRARVWQACRTPSEVDQARRRGRLALGWLDPQASEPEADALLRAGAARVLRHAEQWEERLR